MIHSAGGQDPFEATGECRAIDAVPRTLATLATVDRDPHLAASIFSRPANIFKAVIHCLNPGHPT
jgi:hypothetical protein